MIDKILSPLEKPEVAAELGRRLRLVARRMNGVIERQHFPLPFLHPLKTLLQMPGKLFASQSSRGHPIKSIDRSLWSLSVIVAHAAASDTGMPDAPVASWRPIAPVAAAAEFLGAALDIIDDIQDDDNETVKEIGSPIALNVALALLGLTHAAIDDPQTPVPLRAPLHSLFTSAMLAATGGQFLDLHYEGRRSVTLSEATSMTEFKSGSLIGLLFQVGAFTGGYAKGGVEYAEQISADFARFGMLVGVLAQIANDHQDAQVSDTQHKSDRARGKKTLPLVFETELRAEDKSTSTEIAAAQRHYIDLTLGFYREQALVTLAKIVKDYHVREGALRGFITNVTP